MNKQQQEKLIELTKKALVCISAGKRDENLIYELRDIIRKIENEQLH